MLNLHRDRVVLVRAITGDGVQRVEWDDEQPDTLNVCEPDDDDGYLSDAPPLGARTNAAVGGRFLGTFASTDDATSDELALAAIRDEMRRTNYYPNVWRIDDHGGHHLILDLDPTEGV